MGVTHRGSNIFLLVQTNRNLRNQSLLFLVVSHVLAPRHHLLESEQPLYKNLFMHWKNSQSSWIIFVGYFPINNFGIQSINFFFRSSSSTFFDFLNNLQLQSPQKNTIILLINIALFNKLNQILSIYTSHHFF